MEENKSEDSAVGTHLGDLLLQKGIENVETAPYEARIKYLEQEKDALAREKEMLQQEKDTSEREKQRLEREKEALEQENASLSEELSCQSSLVQTLFDRAVRELKNENHIDAMGLIQAFLIHEPGHIKSMINLAVAYGELGYDDKAKAVLKEVVEREPDNEIAKRNLEILEDSRFKG